MRELPPFFPYKSRIVYSEIETVSSNELVKHKAIKETIKHVRLLEKPLEIIYSADLPSKTGLATSSSLVVSLAKALLHLEGEEIPQQDLMNLAFWIEEDYTNGNIGKQDSAWAVLGGMKRLTFDTGDYIHYEEYSEEVKRKFEQYGILIYTNISRDASKVVSTYKVMLDSSPQQLLIRSIAEEADAVLRNGCDMEALGYLLNQTWVAKRSISPNISTEKVDALHKGVLERGGLGAKLCGAGGGGSIFIISEPPTHKEIIDFCEKEGCVHIPYKINGGVERIL